eukprot:GFYU01016422.1.p2 GENE.GFYU01016422.1~~GFYU01016422.1.p2  ORF type:complete len:102 (-),score=5.42 GFYU01016422.1:191-496(-)
MHSCRRLKTSVSSNLRTISRHIIISDAKGPRLVKLSIHSKGNKRVINTTRDFVASEDDGMNLNPPSLPCVLEGSSSFGRVACCVGIALTPLPVTRWSTCTD